MILFIDEERFFAKNYVAEIQSQIPSFAVQFCESLEEAELFLNDNFTVRLVVLDVQLKQTQGDESGLDWLEDRISRLDVMRIPVCVLTNRNEKTVKERVRAILASNPAVTPGRVLVCHKTHVSAKQLPSKLRTLMMQNGDSNSAP